MFILVKKFTDINTIVTNYKNNEIQGEKMKKVLFISSTGGHLNELLQLTPLFEKYEYNIITEKDKANISLKEKYGDKLYFLPYGTRAKLFTYIFLLNLYLLYLNWPP